MSSMQNKFLEKFRSINKNSALMNGAGFSVLAFGLSACGGSSSTTSSNTGTKLTVTKSSAGTYSEAASVAGIALKDSSSASFVVSDDTVDNRYDITLDATGDGDLEFDFSSGDANDVVALSSSSKVSGFTTLKVVKGTLDVTQLTSLGDITKVEVNSGIKITFAQLKESITEIKSTSGDAAVEITVKTAAEATELTTLVSGGTLDLVGVNTSELAVTAASDATETIDTTTLTSAVDTLKTNVTPATTTTTTTTTVSAPLFQASLNKDTGVVEFSGAATGDISLEWAGTVGSSVAIFTRGGNSTEGSDFGGSASSISLKSTETISDTSADLNNTLITGAGKVTATASSGDQTLKIQTTGANSVATGDGNDTVELGNAANVSNDDEYNLGGGAADVIKITADNSSTGAVFDAAGAVGAETITVLASSTVTHNAKVTLEYGSAYDQNMTIDASAMTCDAADFTLAITSSTNTDGDLTVKGSSGKNTIETGDGADTFEMGAIAAFLATDTIVGGLGTDTLKLTADGDSTGGTFDNDHTGIENITIGAGSTASMNAKLTLNFAQADNEALTIDASGMTNEDADFTLAIDSSNAANADGDYTVTGGAGDDSITTGDGNDTIVGGAGNDTIDGDGQGTGGVDTVSYSDITGSGDQHGITDAGLLGIVVNLTSSTITESTIDTAMDLSAGTDDYYVAGSGIATTKAGYIAAADDQSKADGLDTITNVEAIVGSARADYIALGSGGMTGSGGDGGDTILGGAGDDTISGGNDTDYLTGGDGNDSINGGAGNDNIDGGGGNDTIDVGAGTDTVVIKTAGTFAATALSTSASSETNLAAVGIDVIKGFSVGDKIDISGVANVTIAGTITASATTELADVTQHAAALVSGSYDTSTGKFTEGAYSSTVNDYLLEFTDDTNINAVVLLDVAAEIGTMTNSSDILTAVAPA